MKILTEQVGKNQLQVAIPDTKQDCTYQVEVSRHNFKCLQSEKEYYEFMINNQVDTTSVIGALLIVFVVFVAGFFIGKATSL